MKPKKAIVTIVAVAALFAAPVVNAFSQESRIDEIVRELDTKLTKPQPVSMTLDDCIRMAIQNNPDLRIKQAILNSVDGDKMIDRARFFSHVDFVANFGRAQGTIEKSYYPTLNASPVASLGGLDTSTYSSGKGTSGSTDLSSIAAQFGISDVSSLLSMVPAEYQSLVSGLMRTQGGAEAVSAQRSLGMERAAAQTIPSLNIDQLNQLISQLNSLTNVLSSSSVSSSKTVVDNEVAIRYSQRLLEWGKDSMAATGIRSNRRLAIHNYEQKLRDVIASVRNSFFSILLKKDQIETRRKLLAEYEDKLQKQQKRFEIAKDVPRIDVLTAELDVLNEKNRIDTLKSDLIKKKLELMNYLNMPLGTELEITGELEAFDYSLADAVRLTKENSFQITYLQEELKESERAFKQLAWDYKPIYNAKLGIEDKDKAVGLSLNNSNQTYGLDLGVAKYLNLPSSNSGNSTLTSLLSGSGHGTNNYSMSLGVSWNLYDNTERKGVSLKHVEKLNQSRTELEQEVAKEELEVRKAYQELIEAVDSLKLQKDIVENSRRRLEITRKLREYGKVNEFQVDSLRNTFFSDQDRYFSQQENVISAQENLRRIMGVF